MGTAASLRQGRWRRGALAVACLLVAPEGLAQAAGHPSWPGLSLGGLLAAGAILGFLRLRRLGPAVPRWLAGALPACLALAAVSTWIEALGGSHGASPWSAMALAAGIAALALLWAAKPRAWQPAPDARAPDPAAGLEAPWFLRTTTRDLTREAPEGDLEGAAQSYRAIHDAAAEAIITTDALGSIQSANPACEALFGYRLDEIRGSSLASLVIDLDRLTQGQPEGTPPTLHGRPCEATARRRDGKEFPVELVTSRISRGQDIAFITLLRDISERREAEKALRESNALFRAILEGTRESLFLMDREGRLLAVNPTAAARLGRDPRDIVGATVFDLLSPEVRESRRRMFFEVVESGQPAKQEDHRDGRDFVTHFYPIADENAKVRAVSVFAQDVTEKKRAEDELRLSEARYRNLLDDMQVGYLQSEVATGLIRKVNPALARMLGFDHPVELEGRPTLDFYADPEDRGKMIAALREQGLLRHYPVGMRTRDGRRVPIECHIRLTPAAGDTPALFEAIAIDVSARLETEARLREADQQLRDMTDELPCVVFQYKSDREARGRFTFVGGRVRELDHLTPDAILADPGLLLKNILPADRHAHIASLKRAARELCPWRSDFRVLSAPGQVRWLHAAAVLRRDPGGELIWNGYWLDITDRKLAEEALAQSHNLLQGILDGTGEALVLLDPLGTILAANSTAARRVDRRPQELAGLNFFALFPTEIAVQRRVVFERCLASGTPQSMEDTRGGRHSAINFYPVNDNAGHTQSVVLFARDITEAKRAEASLRESERRYREVFEKLQVGYFRVSVEGRIESVNPRAAQLLGYDSPEELCTRDASDVYFDLADRESLKRLLARDGKVANFPVSLRRKDGTPLHILANSEFLRDASGSPAYIETSVQDVSVLRELEGRLRESEARFRQHLYGLPIEICICDARGVVEYANQQYLATIGYTRHEAPTLAEWWAQAAPDPKYRADISQRWREATLAAAETALPATMPRARLRGKDGVARVFDITARRMGEQYLVVFSNVTAREEAAQALQAAKESAEHAALARAQFLATMSHEIRTPLNGIIGMTELAIATATEDEQRRYLQVARSSADALLGLLNAVLDFSKIEAGRLHPESVAFDARESIGEVLALMRPQAEKKGLALHAHLDPRLPERIVSDPLRMRQVLTNLLANAIKFTETGEIQLEVEVEDREAQELGLHFRVKDTGIGIAEDRLQSIFSSFVQADGSITRRYGGTGLGLAICARLAEILGGSVWAESKLGLGSTFHCTLRVRAAGAEAPRSPA